MRQRTLYADKLAPGIAALLQPIGEHEPRRVVVRVFEYRLNEMALLYHESTGFQVAGCRTLRNLS